MRPIQAERGVQQRLRPIIRELPADVETPISVYLKLRSLSPSFLLESVEGGEHLARYSMIGTQPRAILKSWPDYAVYEEEGRWTEMSLDQGNVLDILRQRLPLYADLVEPEVPRFSGGAIGYMAYDLVHSFDNIPRLQPDTLHLPEAVFLLCDRLVVYDHVKHHLLIIAHASVTDSGHNSVEEAEAAIEEMIARLRRPLPNGYTSEQTKFPIPEDFTSSWSQEDFIRAVRRAKDYIAAGDIFQVVLSRRKQRQTTAQPFSIYRALRRINPSPYMFYLELPDGLRLIGSSPEVLVRLDHGIVETRPLAGTRPRGRTPDEDHALEEALLADLKERAEHVMLVDLGRNDIGRVCRFGSVTTPILMDIERYSHVMHIVSHIRGVLDPQKDAYDVVRACFPAGTVSGAPKIRAMEIIEELEPHQRGPYAGAVGYFGFSGNMDTCIAIRTIVMQGNRAYLQAGAGIVADSDPERELEETENKLRALAQAILVAEQEALS